MGPIAAEHATASESKGPEHAEAAPIAAGKGASGPTRNARGCEISDVQLIRRRQHTLGHQVTASDQQHSGERSTCSLVKGNSDRHYCT